MTQERIQQTVFFFIVLAAMLLTPLVTFLVVLQSPDRPVALTLQMVRLDLDSSTFLDRFAPALPWLTMFWLMGTSLLQGRLLFHWSIAQVPTTL